MSDKTYIVRYAGNINPADRSTQELVRAEIVKEDGEYLVFTNPDGTVVAFFLKSTILDWHEAAPEEPA